MECVTLWLNSNTWSIPFISAIATITIAIATIVYVIFTSRMVSEMYKARQAEFRPYVIMYYEFDGNLHCLVLRNVGKTIARKVSFTFEKHIGGVYKLGYNGSKNIDEYPIFKDGLPYFPPTAKYVFEIHPQSMDGLFKDCIRIQVVYSDAILSQKFEEEVLLTGMAIQTKEDAT